MVALSQWLWWPLRWLRYTAWRYIWSCWLTWRYVDEYTHFPAIVLHKGNRFPFHIVKEPGSRLRIGKRLYVWGYPFSNTASQIYLCAGARLDIQRDFHIGSDVRINLGPGASLVCEGAVKTSFSGLPQSCIIYVKRSMVIRRDTGVSWKTLVMDSDWHAIGGTLTAEEVVLGAHVWVAPNTHILKGARIGDDSIVATGSVVLKGDYPARSLLAGTPAKVLRSGIPDWQYEWSEQDIDGPTRNAQASPK